MKDKIIILLYIFFSSSFFCQHTVSGVITDENNNPMPYVNVILKGKTLKGTSSNENGYYKILIEKSSDSLFFRYLGYKTKGFHVHELVNNKDFKIQLFPNSITLDHVTITAEDKDPAYEIIKNAKQKRLINLNKVNSYSNEIYMKASARLNKIPGKIPLIFNNKNIEFPDSNDLGLIFITESVTKLDFKKPNKIKETMIASRISGYNHLFSFNRAEDVMFNFYKNQVQVSNFSDRDFISPIANNCFFYYKYKLLGSFFEGNQKIYKIKLIPKRKIDPVFKGIIYIKDKSFEFHELDLTIIKDAQLEFIDSIKILQSFEKIVDSVFMPISLELIANFKLFGFSGTYHALGQITKYTINPTFNKNHFSNELFTAIEGANKVDSSYWNIKRNEVLTEEEQITYKKADSIAQFKTSKEYLDSLDAIKNKVKPLNILFRKYAHQNSYDSVYWKIRGLFKSLQYNAIESFVIEPLYTWYKIKEKGTFNYFEAKSKISFGNKRNRPYFKVHYIHNFNNTTRNRLGFIPSYYSNQINSTQPISSFLNTWYTLFSNKNFQKLYEELDLKIYYQQEVFNGFYGKVSLKYTFNRKRLFNQYYNSIIKTNNTLEPNNIDFLEIDQENFPFYNNGVTLQINLSYTPFSKYEQYPYYKNNLGSNWPTLYFNYKKGIGFNTNSFEYDFISAGIGQNIDLNVVGELCYDATIGTFLNTNRINLIDYKHFRGNRTFYITPSNKDALLRQFRTRLDQFYSLDYYSYSTQKAFLEIHAEQRFKGFIFNKIPFLRKLKWKSIFGANILLTQEHGNYFEFIIGIDNIFKLLRVDISTNYRPSQRIEPEFRIRLNFDL